MLKPKVFQGQTITRKILTSFLAISLVPVIFIGYATYKTSEKEIKKTTLENLKNIAESRDDLFNKYITGRGRAARELAFSPTVVNALGKYHKAFHREGIVSREYVAIEEKFGIFFADFIKKFGYHDLIFADVDGNIFFSVEKEDDLGTNLYTGHYKDTELAKVYRESINAKKTGISELKYYAPSDEPAAFISTPVIMEGNIIGALILQLNTDEIYREVQNYIGLGQTGEIVIASREGNEAVFIAPLRHDPEAAFNKKVIIGSNQALPIQLAVQGETGAGLSVDYRSKEILAVWRYLPHLHWGMVVKIDADEAYHHIYKLRNWSFFIGLATVLAVVLIALRISRSISEPIRSLHKGSEIIGGGNLDYKVGTDAKGEIGQLSRAFDKMTLNLKNYRSTLEDEIKERKQVEEKLKESEQSYRSLAENIPGIVYRTFLREDNRIQFFSRTSELLTGYKDIELGKAEACSLESLIHPEDRPKTIAKIKQAVASNENFSIEYRFRHKNGDIKFFLEKGTPVTGDDGKPLYIDGTIFDITDRKLMEEQIRRALDEKELLMKEIHHRVKNNMTVISSLLRLQAAQVKDKEYREMFSDSMNRIKTMASIHEKLYWSKDLAKIAFSEYIEDMTDNMYASYGLSPHRVVLKKDIENITLGIDTATPCGLIVNELLSNSLKYAFPEGRGGEIRVSLHTHGEDEIELIVSDNGAGMPEGLDFRNTDTLGLNLINALAGQLQGKIELNTEQGTEFRIAFRRRE
jgi:PAS domain S-box-containing protein